LKSSFGGGFRFTEREKNSPKTNNGKFIPQTIGRRASRYINAVNTRAKERRRKRDLKKETHNHGGTVQVHDKVVSFLAKSIE
jgi:hypothetical protein